MKKISAYYFVSIVVFFFVSSCTRKNEQSLPEKLPEEYLTDSVFIPENNQKELFLMEGITDSIVNNSEGVAAEETRYKFLGFSEDGNHAAFVFAWKGVESTVSCKITIWDVMRNLPEIETLTYDGYALSGVVNDCQKFAKPLLEKYHISGDNVGTSYHVDRQSGVNIPFDSKIYKLRLSQTADLSANKFFTLEVLTDSEPIIIQQDQEVPVWRGLVVSYKVAACYVLEDKIAVFVEYHGPANDKKAPHQLLVTGVLK